MSKTCPKCKKRKPDVNTRVEDEVDFDDEKRFVYKGCPNCGHNQSMDIDEWQNLDGTNCDDCGQWIDF